MSREDILGKPIVDQLAELERTYPLQEAIALLHIAQFRELNTHLNYLHRELLGIRDMLRVRL